jgi:Xaa-Pro aminopeptidase
MSTEFEKVCEDFSSKKLEAARKLTWESVRAIADQMEVGMLESDAREIAERLLREKGAERFWHRTHVRFGVNTLKTFSETSLPGVRLQAQDLFFIDIGPVWDGYEGDAGASFVLGQDQEMQRCASDAMTLFHSIQDRWKQTHESGEALYRFALDSAKRLGWEFLLEGASGHRISDFPHRLYHSGSLHTLPITPSPQRWILEVHLRHPQRSFGAFYEDLLD